MHVWIPSADMFFIKWHGYILQMLKIFEENLCSDHTRGAATCGFRGYIDLAGRLKLDYYLQTGG